MSSSSKTITFFGATGGCTLAALALSLKAGYNCNTLVRSKSKLQGMLKEAGISETDSLPNLHVTEGDALDPQAVSTALTTADGTVVDTIVFGIGYRPDISGLSIKYHTPTLCHDAIKVILAAIAEIPGATRPLISVISTTGTTNEKDVPFLMLPMYHWMLKVPHKDKRNLEDAVIAAGNDIIRDFIILRPSLLSDGDATFGKVRVGYLDKDTSGKGSLKKEEGGSGWTGVKGIAVGYYISRKDVGAWIYEETVVKDGGEFRGRRVTLTY